MTSRLVLFSLLASISASATAIPSTPPPASALLISSSPTHDLLPCLQSSYHGTYGGQLETQEHVFIPTDDCLYSSKALDEFTSGSIVPLELEKDEAGRIVWVGQAGVEPSVLAELKEQDMGDAWDLISSRSKELAQPFNEDEDSQHVFSSRHHAVLEHTRPIRLLHQTEHSLLLHVPLSYMPIIDTLLPSHLVPVAVPTTPLPATFVSSSAEAENMWEPVQHHFVKNLRNLTANLKFSPEIDRIVSEGIELNAIRRDVRWLTGEAPSGIESRHSFTEGAVKAANWLKCEILRSFCVTHTTVLTLRHH